MVVSQNWSELGLLLLYYTDSFRSPEYLDTFFRNWMRIDGLTHSRSVKITLFGHNLVNFQYFLTGPFLFDR